MQKDTVSRLIQTKAQGTVPPVNLAPEKHLCQQCGKDMGFEWLLGDVCGDCCRRNHARVAKR